MTLYQGRMKTVNGSYVQSYFAEVNPPGTTEKVHQRTVGQDPIES